MQTNAIPVAERLALHRRDRGNLPQMCTFQSLVENLGLHLYLLRIARLLIVAAATFTKVRTGRRNPRRRSLQHAIELSTGIARTIFCDMRFYQFARQRERNEHSFAIGARQSRSAIDRFFDPQLHPWLM